MESLGVAGSPRNAGTTARGASGGEEQLAGRPPPSPGSAHPPNCDLCPLTPRAPGWTGDWPPGGLQRSLHLRAGSRTPADGLS